MSATVVGLSGFVGVEKVRLGWVATKGRGLQARWLFGAMSVGARGGESDERIGGKRWCDGVAGFGLVQEVDVDG